MKENISKAFLIDTLIKYRGLTSSYNVDISLVKRAQTFPYSIDIILFSKAIGMRGAYKAFIGRIFFYRMKGDVAVWAKQEKSEKVASDVGISSQYETTIEGPILKKVVFDAGTIIGNVGVKRRQTMAILGDLGTEIEAIIVIEGDLKNRYRHWKDLMDALDSV